MTERRRWIVGLLLSGVVGAAQAAAPGHRHDGAGSSWTDMPLLVKARGFNRSLALLRPVGLTVAAATVVPSVADDALSAITKVPLRDGKLAVRSLAPRQGGYYRVAALAWDGARARIASTIVYFSNPGPAPRAMLAQPAMPLEIVPTRLPREHRHYRAGETWSFQLRADGHPLPRQPVVFTSAQGTHWNLVSDDQGQVALTFPDDFPPPSPDGDGGHGRGPRAAFVLATHWRDSDGRQLLSAFNYHYTPAAYAGKDLWLGGGFALLGMLAATPLLRGRAKRKEAA